MMQQRLYASHWLGEVGHDSTCQPDLFSATLLPLGTTVRCARVACSHIWTLAETIDTTIALGR